MRTLGYTTTMLWTAASTFGGAAGIAVGAVLQGLGVIDDGTAVGASILAGLAFGGAAVLQGLVLRRGAAAWTWSSAFGSALGWLVALSVLGVALPDLRGDAPLAVAAGAISGCVAAIVQSWWLSPRGVPARAWVLASAASAAAGAGLRFGFAGLGTHVMALVLPSLTMGLVLEAFPAFETSTTPKGPAQIA